MRIFKKTKGIYESSKGKCCFPLDKDNIKICDDCKKLLEKIKNKKIRKSR